MPPKVERVGAEQGYEGPDDRSAHGSEAPGGHFRLRLTQLGLVMIF